MKNTESESFPIQLMVQSYGQWDLGFAWVNVSIGGSNGARGLALYTRLKCREPKKRVCATLKDAIAFLESCKVPARQVILREAQKTKAETLSTSPTS